MVARLGQVTQAALSSSISVKDFELAVLRDYGGRPRTDDVSNIVGERNNARLIECALARASNLPDCEKVYGAELMQAVDDAKMGNYSIQALLMETATQHGFRCRLGDRIHNGNIEEVLEYCFKVPQYAKLSGGMGFTTISLPGILGNVGNKQILAGYMEEDTTWQEIAGIKSTQNFYQQTHYRLLDSLEYDEVGPAGDLKHGKLGQESYTSQAKTYGKVIALTRQQIINDDLSAFDDIRERLGRAAAAKFNNVFWAAFMDNAGFFTTGNGNYITGSPGSVLGTDGAGLSAGVLAYRKLRSPAADGMKRVGMTTVPTLLLVPPELEQIADNLFTNNNAGQVGGSSVNTFAKKYRPVIQNRLSDAGFSGYSPTAWYLFGAAMKPMVVTFLNGQRVPNIQSTDADFSTLGVLFRGVHDFGCDRAEALSGVKSKGAAA